MLKPYAAFSRNCGPSEGAILIVANTVKEAKKLAWGNCLNVDEWTDQAVKLIKSRNVLILADNKLLNDKIPHVIDDPVYCQSCNEWGHGLTSDNLCCNCNCDPGMDLVKLHNGSTFI